MQQCVRVGFAVIIGCAAVTISTSAYVTYSKWGTSTVRFYVNPRSTDIGEAAAEAAVNAAMNAWNNAGSAFRFQYGGRVTDTTHTYDSRNVVMFRNSTNGSTIASTYYWISNATNQLVDTDIVFWDGTYRLFAGGSSCSNGVYVEDVATHEFGHALGLKHSPVLEATMYAIYNLCTQSGRTLAADDINGVRALYGSGAAPANTPPTVSITSPTNGHSTSQGSSTTFTGSANDTQDGNLTSAMVWASSIDGPLGTGSGFSRALSAGSHVIRATATDSKGLPAWREVSVTVTTSASALPPPVTGSPIGTAIPPATSIVDDTGDVWTVANIIIYRNGQNTNGRTTALSYRTVNGRPTIVARGINGGWYIWSDSSGWVSVPSEPAPPPPSPGTGSPIGTAIPPATSIVDDTGDVWTVVNSVIYRNGQHTNGHTTALSYRTVNGRPTIVARGINGGWYIWSDSSGWVSVGSEPV